MRGLLRPPAVLWLLLAIALVACASVDPVALGNESDPPPTDDATVPVRAGTVPATPLPLADLPGGDWPTARDYALDMAESVLEVGDLMVLWEEYVLGWYAGRYSTSAVMATSDGIREVLDTHRAHFRGATPPPDFRAAHDYYVEALDLFESSSWVFARGVRNGDPVLIGRGRETMEQAIELLDVAADALPAL